MRQVMIYPGETNTQSGPDVSARGDPRKRPSSTSKELFKAVAALEEDKLPVPEDRFEALLVAVGADFRELLT